MRKVLLLLALTLMATQRAVAQQPDMTFTAREMVQRENGFTTVIGEVVIRIGDIEIRTDRADIRRGVK